MKTIICMAGLVLMQVSCQKTADDNDDVNSATSYTRDLQRQAYQEYNFENRKNFEQAEKGLIAPLENKGIVKNKKGEVVWDFDRFKKQIRMDKEAPSTVHPSLWRQSQLLTIGGLFEVTPGVYQVRGLDLSNMTIVEGEAGITVYDPLLSRETAKAALDLYYKHRGERKVIAVVYSHSHADHFGGVKGVVTKEQVDSGKVKIYAPVGFSEHAIAENLYAGLAMGRRSSYMFGGLLKVGPRGQVSSGLGLSVSSGILGIIEPTDIITTTGEKRVIDGLEYEFLMASHSEAPADMMWYLPKYKMLNLAENASYTMHNLYTLRGAKTRDASLWAKYLNQVLQTWGKKYQIAIGMHHWPTWGNQDITDHVKSQRDLYKFLHDQTLLLLNKGFTINEIPELIEIPKSIEKFWGTQGYYGSKSHNVRAIYNYYLGYFDGNPSHLDPLTPVEEARHYVEAMGGRDKVYDLGLKAFKEGSYKWAAVLLNHLVFYEPNDSKVRALLADVLTQLGYQSKSGPWRNFYLTGAKELREGAIKRNPGPTREKEILTTLPIDHIFGFMAIQVNPEKAEGKKITINWVFPDTNEKYTMFLENSVLNYWSNSYLADADATITITRKLFDSFLSGDTSFVKLIGSDKVKLEGSKLSFMSLILCLDRLDQYLGFNIIEP